jgi:hypothetical protein
MIQFEGLRLKKIYVTSFAQHRKSAIGMSRQPHAATQLIQGHFTDG